jgi:uncharacterized membrane protein
LKRHINYFFVSQHLIDQILQGSIHIKRGSGSVALLAGQCLTQKVYQSAVLLQNNFCALLLFDLHTFFMSASNCSSTRFFMLLLYAWRSGKLYQAKSLCGGGYLNEARPCKNHTSTLATEWEAKEEWEEKAFMTY